MPCSADRARHAVGLLVALLAAATQQPGSAAPQRTPRLINCTHGSSVTMTPANCNCTAFCDPVEGVPHGYSTTRGC
jgi:hypothetical protein